MSKEKEASLPVLAEEPIKKKQGYTIDELHYQLALTTLQTEFCKEKLINKYNATLSDAPWNKKSGSNKFTSSMVGTLLKGLSYTDYFMVGFSVFKTAKNVFSFFKRKKK